MMAAHIAALEVRPLKIRGPNTPECLLCRPSDGMARRPVDPSRPVVRPDCSPKLLMSHMSQHIIL
jgi:hypothetical protein